jgi:hypothetical protein
MVCVAPAFKVRFVGLLVVAKLTPEGLGLIVLGGLFTEVTPVRLEVDLFVIVIVRVN